MFNMKLFIDTDADSRLSKRVLKDVDELGRDLDQVKEEQNMQYCSVVLSLVKDNKGHIPVQIQLLPQCNSSGGQQANSPFLE